MNGGERYMRLGDMLLHKGALDRRKLARGLKVAQDSRRRLGDVLIDLGYVSEDEIVNCLAEQYGFEREDMNAVQPDPAALEKITAEFALKWGVLALEDGSKFRCVVSDPVNVELTDTITMIARKPLSLTLAPRSVLQHAIRVAYGLPTLTVVQGKRRRPPVPESVLQRDRSMLLEAVNFELSSEMGTRRSG